MNLTKEFNNLSEAESYIETLKQDYDNVKIISYPLFSESGFYVFHFNNKSSNDKNKFLYITGCYSQSEENNSNADYNLRLFGCINDKPTVYINDLILNNSDYNEVEKKAREIYSNYFETNLYNIESVFLPVKVKTIN